MEVFPPTGGASPLKDNTKDYITFKGNTKDLNNGASSCIENEVSNSYNDTSSSCSLSREEDDLEIRELIRNISNRAPPFPKKHSVASVPK